MFDDTSEPMDHAPEEAASTPDVEAITELHDDDVLSPEAHIAESLQSALKQLRSDADAIAGMPVDEARVSAAEQIAEDAAALDEQIGMIARSEDS